MIDNKAKILVVDDEEGARSLLYDYFTDYGYTIKTAKSGEECIEKVKKEKFDMVFLDYFMPPGMNGEEVLPILKKIAPEISVIMISATAEDTPEFIARVKKLGADTFVKEPFESLDDLLELVEKYLKGK